MYAIEFVAWYPARYWYNKEKKKKKEKRKQDIDLLLGNPNGGHTHTSADTHAGNTNLLVRPLQLRQQSANLSGTRAAQGVTERDGATLGVDLLKWDTQFFRTPDALGGEGLVDLVDVDVVLGDAGLLERHGDGLPRADTHEQGLDANHAGGNVLSDDLLAQALGSRTLHEQHGSRTVRDLGGVTGVDGAILGKGRANLSKRLSGDARTDAIICLDSDGLLFVGLWVSPLDLERNDLLVEKSLLLSLESLLVRSSGESVLLGTGNVTGLGHLLGQNTHGHLAVCGLFVVLEELGELSDCTGSIVGQLDLRYRHHIRAGSYPTYPY